jgi:hypothetical protein
MKIGNLILISSFSCIYSFSCSFEPLTTKSTSKSRAGNSQCDQPEQEVDLAANK